MDVVVSVWRVEHFRGIVWILFLGNAHIDSNVSVAKRIVLEFDFQFCTVNDSLQKQEIDGQILVRKSFNEYLQL